MTTTVTVRIDDELEAQIDRLGINASEIVRTALTAEVRRIHRERIEKRTRELSGSMENVSTAEITEIVRLYRDPSSEI